MAKGTHREGTIPVSQQETKFSQIVQVTEMRNYLMKGVLGLRKPKVTADQQETTIVGSCCHP